MRTLQILLQPGEEGEEMKKCDRALTSLPASLLNKEALKIKPRKTEKGASSVSQSQHYYDGSFPRWQVMRE